MINGIIKLFYSEIVKANMKKMPSSQYELRDECREISSIASKIDNVFLKAIKVLLGILILVTAFNINVMLGIGIFSVEFLYIIYKRNMEKRVKESIYNIKTNIDSSTTTLISDRGKSGINLLITLLVLGIITSFNWSIVISFIVVFIFTIKDIYSNIK